MTGKVACHFVYRSVLLFSTLRFYNLKCAHLEAVCVFYRVKFAIFGIRFCNLTQKLHAFSVEQSLLLVLQKFDGLNHGKTNTT